MCRISTGMKPVGCDSILATTLFSVAPTETSIELQPEAEIHRPIKKQRRKRANSIAISLTILKIS
jgi:hypothetical protein